MIRLTGAMVVVLLALVGCSDSNEVDATAADVAEAADSKADDLVGEAVNAVLGDGPFRSRTTGRIPFISGTFNESYEQSGADLIEVSASGPVGSATAIVGDTAHEWDSLERPGWRRHSNHSTPC
ncbi:MAG: hypothetical protein WBF71_13020 [Microthrixaceae bacterium]